MKPACAGSERRNLYSPPRHPLKCLRTRKAQEPDHVSGRFELRRRVSFKDLADSMQVQRAGAGRGAAEGN